MPELPEVETIARTLAGDAAGCDILRVEVLDPSALHPDPQAFAALVTGRRIESVGRRAKLLLLRLAPRGGDGGAVIAVHLRMTGRVFVLAPGAQTERTRAVLHLSGGLRLAFADLRRFGSMHAFADGEIVSWPFYASLGPEPLEMTAKEFRQRLGQGRARIKALLLDQGVVAGIGNIYADEALFRAGIRPDAPVTTVSAKRRDALFAAIQAVLTLAIAENGSSIRDYRDAHGDAGAFQNHFQAYGRGGQACLVCGSTMQAMRVAGRTSTFCPCCQPEGRTPKGCALI
jgi:formamidopyrimidine-DNA glycosylase